MGNSKEEIKALLKKAREKKGREKEGSLLKILEQHNVPEVYNELGIYYREQDDAKKAIGCFEKSLELDGNASAPCSNLASCYFNLAEQEKNSGGEKLKEYMDKTVDYFERAGAIDGTGYFFLGNLYLPKVNAPFADDYEKAVSCFMKVPKKAGLYWVRSMFAIGEYFYKFKGDYLRAAAYYALAFNERPEDKNAKNYYELAIGRVQNYKFWDTAFKKLKDQSEVESLLEEGREALIPKCPYCGSTDIGKYSMLDHLRQSLKGRVGMNRLQYYKKNYCSSCHKEW